MPSRCCVTNCQGNYDNGPKVSVFSFPTDPALHSKWLAAIPRKDFIATKASRVCELHFQEDQIEREASAYDDKTGKKIRAPLKHPRLKKGATPSIFKGCPSYLSSSSGNRESPESKRMRMEYSAIEVAIEESIKLNEGYKKKIKVESFEELLQKLDKQILQDVWTLVRKTDKLLFVIIVPDPIPNIVASVVISDSLFISATLGSSEIQSLGKDYKLPFKVTDVTQVTGILDCLYALYSKNEQSEKSINIHLENVLALLEKLENEAENSFLPYLQFIHEQIGLLFTQKQRRTYSPQLLVFSALLYSISPHSYRFVRSSQNLILPHPITLKRLCAHLEMNPKLEQVDGSFLNYITYRSRYLSPNDFKVVLMMDEVHIKPYFDFKGGSIMGAAYDSKNAASSAYVFMLHSLLSSFKEVVHILPVNKLSADDLHKFLLKLIIGLEKISFQVVCVVSDNNSINRKAMSLFCNPPKLSIVYQNPANKSRPLFFAFDSVHLIKCIRNNWINQKTEGQSLLYPEFYSSREENVILCNASFAVLKKLHQTESGHLLKFGHGLTLKALYPSNLERQNVSLALQIFNRVVCEGLIEQGEKCNLPHAVTTAKFIEYVCIWFEIANVKTPKKGMRYRNVYQEPMTMNDGDERLAFLLQFLDWLELWQSLACSEGALTKETHSALMHTTHALVEMCRYCITELGFSYFLPGKIQTDSLEARFGKYRQLSGSQYNVSITQIFESETKLRLQNCVPLALSSKAFGRVVVDHFDDESCQIISEEDTDCDIPPQFLKITITDDDVKHADNVLPVITYLAGYCTYKLLRKINCDLCRDHLTLEKAMDFDLNYTYIRNLDRGGLLYPSPEIVCIITHSYLIVQALVSSENEDIFLKLNNQHQVAFQLAFHSVIDGEYLVSSDCPKHDFEFILKNILQTSTNTLLKNYCGKRNDLYRAKIGGRSRKMGTLTQKP